MSRENIATIIRRENQFLVMLKGSLNVGNAALFHRFLMSIIDRGELNIVLDFSQVLFISSAGLGALISAQKKLEKKSCQFILTGVNKEIYRVFQLLGFADFFQISK